MGTGCEGKTTSPLFGLGTSGKSWGFTVFTSRVVYPIQLFVSRQVQFKCLPCPYPHIKEVLPFSEEMQAWYFLSINQNIPFFQPGRVKT